MPLPDLRGIPKIKDVYGELKPQKNISLSQKVMRTIFTQGYNTPWRVAIFASHPVELQIRAPFLEDTGAPVLISIRSWSKHTCTKLRRRGTTCSHGGHQHQQYPPHFLSEVNNTLDLLLNT